MVDGDEIKRQAQDAGMGEQLFAIVFKERIIVETKSGRFREKWVRGYRAPNAEDDICGKIQDALDAKLPEWEALDMVPIEWIPDGLKTIEPLRYGFKKWRDLFSPRQLLCHGTSVEVFRELYEEETKKPGFDDVTRAAFGYLALSLDKLRDYNSRMTRWHVNREVMTNTFDRHDFSFKWSYAEMPPLIVGLGYDWAIELTAKCISELVDLTRPDIDVKAHRKKGKGHQQLALYESETFIPPPITISCKSGDSLDHMLRCEYCNAFF